jgi:hypothetical protein
LISPQKCPQISRAGHDFSAPPQGRPQALDAGLVAKRQRRQVESDGAILAAIGKAPFQLPDPGGQELSFELEDLTFLAASPCDPQHRLASVVTRHVKSETRAKVSDRLARISASGCSGKQ